MDAAANALSGGLFPTKTKNLSTATDVSGAFSAAARGGWGFVFSGKPTVTGFSPPTSEEGKSRRQKKQKKLHKSPCGFFPIRIHHGHRRGGHDLQNAKGD